MSEPSSLAAVLPFGKGQKANYTGVLVSYITQQKIYIHTCQTSLFFFTFKFDNVAELIASHISMNRA